VLHFRQSVISYLFTGMDEGAKSGEVERMKALAAEKRRLRDEKLAKKKEEEDEDEDVDSE